MAALTVPKKNVSRYIRSLAKKNCVEYTESKLDKVARVVTRLAGDDVKPDEVESLLIHLRREGFIAGSEMVILHSRYLDEIKLKAAAKVKSEPKLLAVR
jgi:hypothetical protein